jgi:hypothetical protein
LTKSQAYSFHKNLATLIHIIRVERVYARANQYNEYNFQGQSQEVKRGAHKLSESSCMQGGKCIHRISQHKCKHAN